jgi:ribosomal protein S18 acetylase RimI-like enzyme
VRLVRQDPGLLDPAAFAERQGIALEAVSEKGDRLGAIAARVDGRVAAIFERWVSGEPAVLAPLAGRLVSLLVAEFGVAEIRASADSDSVYSFYLDRLGMKPWHELITYERPVTHSPVERPIEQSPVDAAAVASIRPFTSTDGPVIGLLIGNAEGAAELLRLAERSPSRFVVATFEGCIAGYALSYVDGSYGLLKSLVVDACFRQRGIGRALTCDAIAWCHRLGLPSRLHTQGDNHAARRLYEGLGYGQVARARLVHKVIG